MKRTLLFIAVTVISVIVLSLMLNRTVNLIKTDCEIFQKRIGQKVKLNDDTLIIVDYSLFDESYTLSNGIKIDTNLIRSISIK